MKKEIILNNTKITYTLRKNKRAKHLRISIGDISGVIVTLPSGVFEFQAKHFLKIKADWILEKINQAKLTARQKEPQLSVKEINWYKIEAKKLVIKKIKEFNSSNVFLYNKIFIKKQRTRWGSCSSNKNLNFNYKIALLPDHLSEYIVIHELCHLIELNHSKRFWNLVESYLPDYKTRKKELKNHCINKKLSPLDTGNLN